MKQIYVPWAWTDPLIRRKQRQRDIVPIHKKGDKTDCSNYMCLSLLPTTYKHLSNILLSRLTPYAEEIIGVHQCGFRHNRSTTDRIFCNRQIIEKNGDKMKQCISCLQTSRKLMFPLGGLCCIIFSLSLVCP
jgi:hypothetical protein